MTTPPISPVYDDLLDYIIDKATPEEILAYSASDEAQERANDLLERSSAGTLSPDEVIELEQMRQVDRLVAVLKARALQVLRKS